MFDMGPREVVCLRSRGHERGTKAVQLLEAETLTEALRDAEKVAAC